MYSSLLFFVLIVAAAIETYADDVGVAVCDVAVGGVLVALLVAGSARGMTVAEFVAVDCSAVIVDDTVGVARPLVLSIPPGILFDGPFQVPLEFPAEALAAVFVLHLFDLVLSQAQLNVHFAVKVAHDLVVLLVICFYPLFVDVISLAVAVVAFAVATVAVLSKVVVVEVSTHVVVATEGVVRESNFLDRVLVLQRFPCSRVLSKNLSNL